MADLSASQLVEWSPGTFAVRLRAELVGNASRMVHLVPIPETTVIPDSLSAYCGKVILPGQAELVRVFEGMPCTLCMVFAPNPHLPENA